MLWSGQNRWRRLAIVALVGLSAAAPAGGAVAPPPGYAVTGIDVSLYQGTVDWAAAKAGGVSFAYIRASEQASTPDVNFAANYAAAKARGLFVGAYHRAKPDASSGKAQADYFLNHAQVVDDGATLPPVVDMEWPRSGWTSPTGQPLNACYNMTPAQLVAWTHAFLSEVVVRTGRAGVVYTSTNWWKQCTNSDTSFGHNPLWVARYSTSPLPLPAGWAGFTFWQYTSSGTLPNGTAVDQDVFNGTTAALAWLARGAPNAVTSWVDAKYQHLAYLSGDGHTHELYAPLAGGAWRQVDLTTAAGAPSAQPGSALTSWIDAEYQHVAYLSGDGHAHELYFRLTGGGWKQGDLTAAAGSPTAQPGSALTSWIDAKYQHLAYLSSDGHAHELYYRLAGGGWRQSDLTTATDAPTAQPGSALTSWVDAKYQHLAYLSSDGHTHELYFPLTGGAWRQSDLTAAAGAPAAQPASALTSWIDLKYQHMAYLSGDGHTHELYFPLTGGGWRQVDLTAAAGAPTSQPGSALTSWVDSIYQHLAYVSGDGHAHELYFRLTGGGWKQGDLTIAAGTPTSQPGSALTSWIDRTYQHVAYLSDDGHAQALFFPLAGGGWKHSDLTAAAGAPPAQEPGG